MSVTAAVFYLDYEGGSDTARTALTSVTVSNPSGSITRCNKTGHGLVTGAVVDLTAFSSWLNEGWKITVVDADNFDLDGAVWQSTADASGTATPRGGSSKTDAWKTITSGATSGRLAMTSGVATVRIMGSPDKTSLGQNGKWTEAGPNNTSYNIVSSTNATPIVVTLSSGNYTLLAPAVDDTVRIVQHGTNTKANGVWKISAVNGSTTITLVNADGTNSVGNGVGGASGNVRKINNHVVTLTSEVTKNIALQGNQGTKTNWTPSANVTSTINTTTFIEGAESLQLAIASGFTTGLAAYYPTGTLDLSGYQQVSFRIQQTSGTLAIAGDVSLRLCTDTAGVTSVHTIAIPSATNNNFCSFTVDLGTNLNSAIESIAFYVDTDRGAQTFLIDNIIAVKDKASADSLSLTSLISKDTADEPWCNIRSINSTRVVLGEQDRGYSGVTETVNVYKREGIKLVAPSTDFTVQANAAFEGGWDRTNMTTQNLESFFYSPTVTANGYVGGQNATTTLNKCHFFKVGDGLNVGITTILGTAYTGGSSNGVSFVLNAGTGSVGGTLTKGIDFGSQNGLSFAGNGSTHSYGNYVGEFKAVGNGAYGCQFNANSGNVRTFNNRVGVLKVLNAGVTTVGALVFTAQASKNIVDDATVKFCAGYGVSFNYWTGLSITASIDNWIKNLVVENNVQYAIDFGLFGFNRISGGSSTGNAGCVLFNATVTNPPIRTVLRNFTVNEAVKVAGFQTRVDQRASFENFGGVVGDHRIYCDDGLIVQQTATVHGEDNYGWKYSPTSTNRSAVYPLDQVVARIAVAANAQVTVSRWFRRTNTGLTGRLVCKGGQLTGISADVVDSMTAAADEWEQLSIQFTPTEKGVVEITEEWYGGTTYDGYTSDWTITQA